MKNIAYVTFMVVIFLQSCTNEVLVSGAYPIPMPQELKDVGNNITADFEILQLQTGEKDTLLADIKKVVSLYDRLYLLSQSNGSVYIFGNDGSFVKKLSQGRGPGEFLSAYDILIDRTNENLEVLSGANVFRYDRDGNFINKIELPRALIMEFGKVGDKYLLYTPRITDKNKYYFRLYDSQTGAESNLVEGFPLPLVEMKPHIGQDRNGEIYFNGMCGETLYTINEDGICKEICRFAPFISDIPTFEIEHFSDLADKITDKYICFCGVRNVGTHLLEMCVCSDRLYNIVYDTSSKTAYRSIFDGVQGIDYVGYDSQWSYYAVYPYLVSEMDSVSKMHPMARQIVEGMRPIAEKDIEGNPIIIKLKYEMYH